MSNEACGVCAVDLEPVAPGYVLCRGCGTVTPDEVPD